MMSAAESEAVGRGSPAVAAVGPGCGAPRWQGKETAILPVNLMAQLAQGGGPGLKP